MGKRSYYTIQRYVLSEFLASFMTAFLFFFFIFFINQLLVLAKNILISIISPMDVLKIIVYSIPIILSFTFPFATLSGAAMSLGTLSSNREIIALRSSGIPNRRIILPIIICGILFSGISFIINDVFLPLGTIEYRRLYRDLLYTVPSLEIRPYSSTMLDDRIIVTRDVSEQVIEQMVIIDTSQPLENRSIIHADSGSLSGDLGTLLTLSFDDVTGIQGRDKTSFQHYNASSMEMYISLGSLSYAILSVTPAEMSFLDVYNEVRSKEADLAVQKQRDTARMSDIREKLAGEVSEGERVSLQRELDSLSGKRYVSRSLVFYQLELWKKLALPLGCFFLLFLAFPIVSMPLQHGKVIGFGVGIILSTVYWFLLFIGQTLGVRTEIPPFMLMFGPNLLYAALGITLFVFFARR